MVAMYVIPSLRRLRQEDWEFPAKERPLSKEKKKKARHRWLTPIILATREAEGIDNRN
jgi:hypothetical protein